MRQPVRNAGHENQPLPNPGSTWALINVETGESDPLQIWKIFVPKDPCQIPVYVTHKVTFRDKETQLTSNRRAPGPGEDWSGNYRPRQHRPIPGDEAPTPVAFPLRGCLSVESRSFSTKS